MTRSAEAEARRQRVDRARNRARWEEHPEPVPSDVVRAILLEESDEHGMRATARRAAVDHSGISRLRSGERPRPSAEVIDAVVATFGWARFHRTLVELRARAREARRR